MCGSIFSIAPEMLLKRGYDHQVDMWGLGVILYELFTNKKPFYSDDEYILPQLIVKMKVDLHDLDCWAGVSCEAKDLLLKLLDKNSVTRIKVGDALRHPWLL